MRREHTDLRAYLGGYTTGDAGGPGLAVLALNHRTGEPRQERVVDLGTNPSFLAPAPSGRTLYAVNEVDDGLVTALGLGPDGLRPLGVQPTLGALPCHLSVDPSGGFLLTANYGSGSIVVHPIAPDGGLGEATDLVQHTGSGLDPQRQEGPHAHQVLGDPSGRWVLAVDLGSDSVLVHRLDPRRGRLHTHAGARLRPGSGPRHLAFHPTGRFAYLVGELDSTLIVCRWDPENGKLRPERTLPTVAETIGSRNYPAAVVVSGDGRFCYVSNRGHDSIATFALSDGGASARLLGTMPSGGSWPRDLALDPSGRHLYACNERGHSVVCFKVTARTGQLHATGAQLATRAPSCLVIPD
ncbi:hypothetical protein GCM10012275_28930 [Longimycelium tulufanense]|uniref:6-phosphogluconolactonase n=1 Tax=Longimycelium tulufanense TaxID=907463 RepID=A0A8J3FWT8_9PSEU|nr:lactonase family protein [Longimycelium tulufanense]GGM56015.1 hypothetical protein GCM10012275_28930 [Longimycelium tulufanense]